MATKDFFHQIRNALSPIQTFIDIVEVPLEDNKLKIFQQRCKEKVEEIKELLKDLEEWIEL